MVAGLLVILVGYSGPVLIIQQAAINAGLSDRLIGSWIFTVSFGAGLAGAILSLWFRQPVIVAFSSAGAVLLTTSLQEYEFSAAIGAYLLVSIACVVIGVTSSFSWLMARVPAPIVSAMLAGVLFRFGVGYFGAMPGSPERWQVTVLVVLMGAAYFTARARGSRLAVVWTCAAGLVAAVILRLTTGVEPSLHLVRPQATSPSLDAGALIGLGLPLLALALSSQFAPGYGVLREAGYEPRMNPILAVTGGIGVLLAPFGCPGLNLAAITAGLATGPDSHPNPAKRYLAGLWAGAFYMAIGLLGLSALSIFTLMPPEFVAAVTGLALFGTIIGSAANALADPSEREAAGATLLCAAGGFTLFHVGAPFWALVAGVSISVLRRRITVPQAA